MKKLYRIEVFNNIPLYWGSIGYEGLVIFLAEEIFVHHSLRNTKLVTIFGLIKGYFVIPGKSAYMDDNNWENKVKVASPGIRKMKVNSFFVRFLFYYLYI